MYESTTSPYLGLFIFDQPYLIIRDIELIKSIFITDFDYFVDRLAKTNCRDTIGSKMLFLLKGNTWKEIRRSSTPLFSPSKLKNMIPLIDKVGDTLIQFIENNLTKKSLDCRDVALKFQTDVISSCVFGLETNALLNQNVKFVQAALSLDKVTLTRAIQVMSCFFIPALVNILNMTFLDRDGLATVSKTFFNARNERIKSGVKRGDLFDLLNEIRLHTDDALNSEYAAALAVQIVVAGHESSGLTVSFLLFELSQNIDIQNRLRNEIQNVLNDNGGIISYDAIKKMTYLDMALHETLRKYPPLAFIDRRCTKPYKIPGTDLVIEKGVGIYIPVLGLHHDEKYYPNPKKFDPERFLPDNRISRPTCAYMPFGEGLRYCIGNKMALLSMKIFLIKAIANFIVTPTENTPKSIVFDTKAILLTPKDGKLNLKFSRI